MVTTKINGISINDCLMKSAVHNSEQLFRFIIFHFRINVHSCFAIFMSGKILNGLWINPRIEQVGDVSMPQLVRGHIKVQRIFDFRLIFCVIPSVGVTVYLMLCPFTYL